METRTLTTAMLITLALALGAPTAAAEDWTVEDFFQFHCKGAHAPLHCGAAAVIPIPTGAIVGVLSAVAWPKLGDDHGAAVLAINTAGEIPDGTIVRVALQPVEGIVWGGDLVQYVTLGPGRAHAQVTVPFTASIVNGEVVIVRATVDAAGVESVAQTALLGESAEPRLFSFGGGFFAGGLAGGLLALAGVRLAMGSQRNETKA